MIKVTNRIKVDIKKREYKLLKEYFGKYGEEKIKEITMLFLKGKSYRAIAKEMGCSVGLVHKILNEHKQCK